MPHPTPALLAATFVAVLAVLSIPSGVRVAQGFTEDGPRR
jgi:hypothetical protein